MGIRASCGGFIVLALGSGCGRGWFDATGDASTRDIGSPDVFNGPAQTLVVAQPADDGEIDVAAHWPDGEIGLGVAMGYWDTGPVWGYFRFSLTTALPATGTIVGAELQLWGQGNVSFTPDLALAVLAEVTSDAPPVASLADRPGGAGGRSLTSAVVTWPETGGLTWSIGAWNVTPNLAPLIAELIATFGGLAPGTHIQLWIRGNYTVNAEAACEDFSAPSTNHATFAIRWTP